MPRPSCYLASIMDKSCHGLVIALFMCNFSSFFSSIFSLKVIFTEYLLAKVAIFCCFDVCSVWPPQIFQVQAKISTVRPVFPDYLSVSYNYGDIYIYIYIYINIYIYVYNIIYIYIYIYIYITLIFS